MGSNSYFSEIIDVCPSWFCDSMQQTDKDAEKHIAIVLSWQLKKQQWHTKESKEKLA